MSCYEPYSDACSLVACKQALWAPPAVGWEKEATSLESSPERPGECNSKETLFLGTAAEVG